jgi:hypothetical protein
VVAGKLAISPVLGEEVERSEEAGDVTAELAHEEDA